MDAIYKRIGVDSEPQPIKQGESEIRKFYAGKTVLVTGATGTLGKLVVEKLLKECSDLKKIFVLCRAKDDLSLNERRDTFLQSIVSKNINSLKDLRIYLFKNFSQKHFLAIFFKKRDG